MPTQAHNPKTFPILKITSALLFCSGLLYAGLVSGQSLTERLILTDTKDSVLVKAESVSFDLNGDYLFEIKENDTYYFINKEGKTPPLNFNWGSSVTQFSKKDDKKIKYYQCGSAKLFGPITGTDIGNYRHPESKNAKHIAIPCLEQDSITIYIDGVSFKKVDTRSNKDLSINSKKASQMEAKKNSFESDEWAAFSNNGNVIVSVENNLRNRLYVNGVQIDSSESSFYQLAINDRGDYVYAKGRNPLPGEDKDYNFMFFIHTKDTILGYIRTVWNYDLRENGGYYYNGDDNGTDYIAINNKLYKGIESVSHITIANKHNHLFTYKEKGMDKINVNGKIFSYLYQEIYNPILDTQGNFAFYGLNNYYLYKYVNGKQIATPLSQYDVRAMPLYISPTGVSLHYFQTEDSTYLYRDNQLVFPPFSNTQNFGVQPFTGLVPDHSARGESNNGQSLLYIEIDTVGYFVYNGIFSKPMKPASETSYMREKKSGEIVAGAFTDNGFYSIQKTGDTSFSIIINNRIYQELEGVQEVVKNSCYFDGKSLVFYGIKGLSFYRYTLTL